MFFYPKSTPNTLYVCVDDEIDLSVVMSKISSHFPGVPFQYLTIINSRLPVQIGSLRANLDFLVVQKIKGESETPEFLSPVNSPRVAVHLH
jgi:hypothetical protein